MLDRIIVSTCVILSYFIGVWVAHDPPCDCPEQEPCGEAWYRRGFVDGIKAKPIEENSYLKAGNRYFFMVYAMRSLLSSLI